MKIVFFGTPEFVLPVLSELRKHATVVGVITAPDTVQGRKKELTATPVKKFALENHIPVITPHQFDQEVLQQIQAFEPDLFVVAAYGKIIPQAILTIPRFGSLNIHPSLLPLYRGPSPIQTAILHGDQETGVTIIKMDAKMDHGPIVAQESVVLRGDETFADLHVSLFSKAADMLPSVIEEYIKGDLKPEEQEHDQSTYCHMIEKQSGYFDFTNPPTPVELDRMIRAYYPWPTAWSKWQTAHGKWQIIKFLPENKVQLEGGKPMSMKDLRNGHPELAKKIEELKTKN